MIRLRVAAAALAWILFGCALTPATAACRMPRFALAIGNARYHEAGAALRQPEGDIRAVASALGQLGFNTSEAENLSHDRMRLAIDDFLRSIKRDSVAALVFDGYALQAGGRTYLLPVDAAILTEADVRVVGFDLNQILADLADRGARLRLVIIDAARRNPFEPHFRPGHPAGLADVKGSPGLVLLFGAAPGELSDNVEGDRSPFVKALVDALAEPDAMVEEAFRQAKQATVRASYGAQVPWMSSFLDQDVALADKDCAAMHTTVATVAPSGDRPKDLSTPAPARVSQATPPTPAPPVPPQSPAAALPSAVAAPVAPPSPPTATPALDPVVTDPALLREINDRLYDQGFEPGAVGSEMTTNAIRGFERREGWSATGRPTSRLLESLRSTPTPSPWGSIAFAKNEKRWGMSWAEPTRRAALADAQQRCGSTDCFDATTFSGHRCGAFALSSAGWSITWREDETQARDAALDICGKRGSTCHIVGAVCADGSGRVSSQNQ